MNPSGYTLSLASGMQVEITVPTNPRTGDGHFPLDEETVQINGYTRPMVSGFAIENESIGELQPIDDNKLSIMYLHKSPEVNRIHFFSSTGLHQIISVIAIPVHDHSSIVQGGPAYGTYATDHEG